jgi:uncharacterized OB-fold protein
MNRRIKKKREKIQTSQDQRLAEKASTPKKKRIERHRKLQAQNPGRRCQICGKNPYPNYYFCPKCHGHTDFYSELEDEDYNAP